MATMNRSKPIKPTKINAFLGLNENADGETGLKLGEASYMRNFRITKDLNLKKRDGTLAVFTGLTGNVQGMWYGKLNGTTYFLFCNNGHLYSGNLTDGTKVDLGTLTDAPTRFIGFENKVYLNNGYEYKSFDGVVATPSTNSLVVVAGYRPLVAINAPAGGGGTPFEQLNVLNGMKHMTFSTSVGVTEYTLNEESNDTVDFVILNGITLNTMDYSVNAGKYKITLVAGPGAGVGNLDIGWTKGTGQRDLIEKCRFSMDYSGQTDSRVFLWGNSEYKSRRFWSGLEVPTADAPGTPSAEYFEANSYSDEGSGQYGITDIVKQYDRQKIFLENGARYSYYTTETVDGVLIVDFPSFELNEEVGNVAEGQVQIINNAPLTIYTGVHAWEASTVRDETNQRKISDRVQNSLSAVNLTTAKTINYKAQQEYWLNVGSVVWIYNYRNDTWYQYDGITATCFIEINGVLYYGMSGSIRKFDSTALDDVGTTFKCEWKSGFYAFEEEWLYKYLNQMLVSLKPELRNRVDVQVITNTEGESETQIISSNHITYANVNYAAWSYNTSYNPQPYPLEVDANGFVYLQIVLVNESDVYSATVLGMVLPARYGGRVRV